MRQHSAVGVRIMIALMSFTVGCGIPHSNTMVFTPILKPVLIYLQILLQVACRH